MSGEDALTAKGMDGKGKIEDIDEPQHKKKEKKDLSPNKNKKLKIKKKWKKNNNNNTGSSNPLNKIVNFTPLNMLVEKVLLQIKDDPNLRWPKPLSSLPHRWY